MNRPIAALRIGAWSVDPATDQIARDGEVIKLEARTMRLLLCLAERAGVTVSSDELMDRVWSGTIVTQDSVYQAVASLRRLLGDDPKKPTYILTVPRRGYRMVATVVTEADSAASAVAPAVVPDVNDTLPRARRWRAGLFLGVGVLAAAALALILMRPDRPTLPSRSVAVLPFLDLTSQAMNEEYFADGMTEELITRLSRIPGIKVPSATASFYFKEKQLPVAAIADALKVAYVLDGSVRRSGPTLRVVARLVRADDGFVVWSETYDRRSEDLLAVQDDIASRVARTLEDTGFIPAPYDARTTR